MTTTYSDDGLCHENSGFLFSHRCDRMSEDKCGVCQKPVCQDHAHLATEGILCTTCLKRQTRTGPQKDPEGASTADRPSRYHDDYYSSPYFYGTRYYPGFGYGSHRRSAQGEASGTSDMTSAGGDFDSDPLDFTEGDAGSFQREEDGDFETDMGAS